MSMHACRILFVTLCLLFLIDLTRSLPPSAVRELSGLDSKRNRFSLPVFPNGTAANPFVNVSKACDVAVLALLKPPYLSLARYIDASGKPQSGMLAGNVLWLGSYGVCQNISEAQYCLATDIKYQVTPSQSIPLSWGLCIPAACSEKDVAMALSEIVQVYLAKLHVKLGKEQSVYCARPSKWTTGPIITLVVCCIIAYLCLIGTLLDLCLVQKTWKFWFPSAEFKSDRYPASEAERSLAHDSNHESSPLLRTNVTTSSSLSSSYVQFAQPSSKLEQGFLVRFLTCFSLTRNTSKIMDCNAPPGAITSVNGVRVLSMWWVILGHTYGWLVQYGIVNDVLLELSIIRRFSFEAISSAFFSVDSFFLLSGLLVAYVSLRRMEKNDGNLPLFQFYFHRFWRLTPSYMFLILFFSNLYQFLGEGPLWYGSQKRTGCDDYWWTNLLYINNFYPKSLTDECVGWSWYLANDMQFYVISPLLLFLIYRFKWIGLASGVGGLLSTSFVVTGVIIGVYNIDVILVDVNNLKRDQTGGNFMDKVYIKPYCRIAPYLVGVALGYLIHIEKSAPRQSPLNKIPKQIVCLVGWLVATGLGLTVVYGIYTVTKPGGTSFNKAENVTYGTFSRFVWGLALAWVIYACQKGYGSLVNKFLSASYWIPLSRLTYSAYLVHPVVLSAYFGSFQNTTEYTDKMLAFYFVSVVVMSYAAAFVLAVCVEFPMMQLESVLFFKNKSA